MCETHCLTTLGGMGPVWCSCQISNVRGDSNVVVIFTSETIIDAAQSSIISKAEEWKPDLIMMGSHGRSGFRRLVLGSVSEHVLNHTKCSVRIGRHHSNKRESIRLVIGIDGSGTLQTLRTIFKSGMRPRKDVVFRGRILLRLLFHWSHHDNHERIWFHGGASSAGGRSFHFSGRKVKSMRGWIDRHGAGGGFGLDCAGVEFA